MGLKLWAVVHFEMGSADGLPTDLREEFPQGGTGVHMAPAFWSLLRELDDRHSRGHFHPGLLPSAADTMAGDGLSLGELSFDLSSKVSDDRWAEEVLIVHLCRATGLDHLHIDLLPAFGFAQIHKADLLPGLIEKVEVVEPGLFAKGTFSLLLSHPLKGDLPVPKGELGLQTARATNELERIGDDFLRLKPPGLLDCQSIITEPEMIMQLLCNIRIYASEIISQRHTDITANAFSSCQPLCKIRNPAKDIIANLGDFIPVKRPHCFGVNPNFSITHMLSNEVGVIVRTTVSGGGFCGFGEGIFEGFSIALGLFCFGGIDERVDTWRWFPFGEVIGDFEAVVKAFEELRVLFHPGQGTRGTTSSGLDANVPSHHGHFGHRR